MGSGVLVVLVITIVVIAVVVLLLIKAASNKSKLSTTVSDDESGGSSKNSPLDDFQWPKNKSQNFNPDGQLPPTPNGETGVADLDTLSSRYAITLPPGLEAYRTEIFRIHIDDIRLPQDLKTDVNYSKIVAALKTYDRAPTVEELIFMLKYKQFLDMPGVYSMCGPREIDQLYLILLTVIANRIPGDFIETGVWRGGIILYAKAVFNYYSASNQEAGPPSNRITDDLPRRVIAFDAWDQFPAPEPVIIDESTGDSVLNAKDSSIHSITKMMYDRPADVIEVRDAFRSLNLLDNNVSLVKGLFLKTIPAAIGSGLISDQGTSIAVLRIDNDYYDSVYFVLSQLYFKISSGGFCIVDDFNNPVIGCKEAVLRFRGEQGITTPIIDTYGGSVYWQVSKVHL